MLPTSKTLAAALVTCSLLAAGCGVNSGVIAPLTSDADANLASVYQVKGEAHLVIKRRGGSKDSKLRVLSTVRGLGVQVVSVPMAKLQSTLQELRSDGSIDYVEPARRFQSEATTVTPGAGSYFSQQYAPQLVRAPQAWTKTRGAGVTIAIVDTGVDTQHPDLATHVVEGYNALQHNSDVKDDNGHGTHCAGVAAASANQGLGVAGMAPEARVMPIKVLAADGSGSDAGIAEGITWAVDHGANVLNLSFGGTASSRILGDAVAYALQHGVTVVAAMGNDGTRNRSYPAAYPGVLAVGATDNWDRVAGFSQYGEWISVSAPGVSILSTFPTYHCRLNDRGASSHYAVLNGTSMASPAVAGLAALVRAAHPELNAQQVKARIEQTSARIPGFASFDPRCGSGRIDAERAVS